MHDENGGGESHMDNELVIVSVVGVPTVGGGQSLPELVEWAGGRAGQHYAGHGRSIPPRAGWVAVEA